MCTHCRDIRFCRATFPQRLEVVLIPWSINESRRADPRNGVCLNSLYDKAFDRGLVTFSDDLKVVISPVLHAQSLSQFHQWALLDIEGTSLNLPARFAPDPIDWHSTASMSFWVRNFDDV